MEYHFDFSNCLRPYGVKNKHKNLAAAQKGSAIFKNKETKKSYFSVKLTRTKKMVT